MENNQTAMLSTLIDWSLYVCPDVGTMLKARRPWVDWAPRNGNVDVYRQCEMRGATSTTVGPFAHFHLPTACEFGCTNLVRDIISHNRYTICKNQHVAFYLIQGLRIAAKYGWLLTAKLLLDSGASVNMLDESGNHVSPALYFAVYHKRVDMVVLLLAFGARVPEDMPVRYPGTRGFAMQQGGVMGRLIQQVQ